MSNVSTHDRATVNHALTLGDLREFMDKKEPRDVHDWNQAREEAKATFSNDLITALDVSGYIVEVLTRNIAKYENKQDEPGHDAQDLERD